MDTVDSETRSRMMSGIRGKDTQPELLVRKGLHRLGFRFALHKRKMPGRPDLVLPKYCAAVFVHGCYWHRHSGCAYSTTPSTRPEFWAEKFGKNIERDKKNLAKLQEEGWRVFVVWECGLRHDPAAILTRLGELLKTASCSGTNLPETPPRKVVQMGS